MSSDLHVEYRYLSPVRRVNVEYDTDTPNPLEDWDHGVSFHGFDASSRRDWAKMSSSNHGAGHLDFLTIGAYREYYGDSVHWELPPMQCAPSLRTFLNNHAVWLPLWESDRDGLHVASDDPDDWTAVAYIPLVTIRREYGVKRITKRIRDIVESRLRGVMDEYRNWADGDVYSMELQEHNPKCPYCDPADDPDTDCPCWDGTDSIGGIIGSDYIDDAIANYFGA